MEAGRGARREAVQDERRAELVAHDRRDLVRLLCLAFLALHPGGDAHHDDDDEHRHPVREDVHQGDARKIGQAAGRADHGRASA